MPRVIRVNKARNQQGECGKCGTKIKAGDPYVWWKFRFGGRRVRCAKSACSPKPSDLTQSAFLSAIYDFQETVFSGETSEDLSEERDSIVSDIENLKDETEGKLQNMPEGLQQGDTGQLLQERIDGLDSVISELENVDCEPDIDEEPDREDFKSKILFDKAHEAWEEERDEKLEQIRTELSDALQNLPS